MAEEVEKVIAPWNKLQIGTDIQGIAIETADYPVTLTFTMVRLIAHGFF